MLKEKLNNKNLDETIWENVKKIDKENFDKIENELKIKFPENDVKYLKNFNRGTSINTVFIIDDKKFNIELLTFEYKYFNKNLDYFHESTGNYFANRKIVPVISKTQFLDEIRESKEYVVAYDFTKNNSNPEIVYIMFKNKDIGKDVLRNYVYIEDSVTEKKLGDKSSVILDYMYVTDEKPKEAEVGWLFEEFSIGPHTDSSLMRRDLATSPLVLKNIWIFCIRQLMKMESEYILKNIKVNIEKNYRIQILNMENIWCWKR